MCVPKVSGDIMPPNFRFKSACGIYFNLPYLYYGGQYCYAGETLKVPAKASITVMACVVNEGDETGTCAIRVENVTDDRCLKRETHELLWGEEYLFSFEFTAPDHDVEIKLWVCHYDGTVDKIHDERTFYLEVRLEGKLLEILVKDTRGRPIQGVKVELCFDCGGYCSPTSRGYESHFTDSQGRVRVDKRPPGLLDPKCLTILVSKSGYSTQGVIRDWDLMGSCEEFEFTLEREELKDITITVLSDGPVENARVDLYKSDGTLIDTQYTDAYGRARFYNLSTVEFYYVVISKDGYKEYQSTLFQPTDLTFTIEKTSFCFRVKVINEQGYPVENATVEIYDSEENLLASDTTNHEGLTDFFTADEPSIIIVVKKEGYVEHRGTLYPTSIPFNSTVQIELYSENVGDIIVEVTDQAGNPIYTFTVYYKKKTEEDWKKACSVKNAKTNECVIEDVEYGTYDVKAENPDYGDATANISHFSPTTRITIPLGARTGKISVKFRVYSREGGALIYSLTPLEGVSVTLECEEINYKRTLKTNKEGEADFGEIDLQGESERTFHYKVYYNEYWQPFEKERTFVEGHTYDIEIHLERCSELIPGWQRSLLELFGVETEDITCEEAEALKGELKDYLLLGVFAFFALLLLALLS